jgi:hypothetical protein
VFPKSWYPETTGTDIEKWKIPVCEPCNKEHGVREQDLMILIGLCIDRHAIEAAGIVPKVLRSLIPDLAKNEKDRRAREAKRTQVLKRLLKLSDFPSSAIYPGFEERWGRPPKQQIALPIAENSVRRLFEKIIRGLVYIEDGRFIEPPYTVDLYLHEHQATEFASLLDKFGKVHACGPGIVVQRAVAREDGLWAVYKITMWGRFQTYATVTKNEPNLSLKSDAANTTAPVS